MHSYWYRLIIFNQTDRSSRPFLVVKKLIFAIKQITFLLMLFSCGDNEDVQVFLLGRVLGNSLCLRQWNHPKNNLISSSTSSQALYIPVLSSSWTSLIRIHFPNRELLASFFVCSRPLSSFTIFIFIPKTYQFYNNKLNGTDNFQQRL